MLIYAKRDNIERVTTHYIKNTIFFSRVCNGRVSTDLDKQHSLVIGIRMLNNRLVENLIALYVVRLSVHVLV